MIKHKFLTLSIISAIAINAPSLLAKEIQVNDHFVSFNEESDGYSESVNGTLEDFYGDEDFVSIATGIKQLISKAPSTATVITQDDIQHLGAVTIDEILESVAGLHVSYKSANNLPIYTFRGIYSAFNAQVLMLINGVPITNIFLGNRNQIWGGMSLEAVARIEIIRGPGSALFGADASAGVINIITKSSKTASGSNIGIRAGSFSTKDYWFNHSWTTDNLGGFISYERHETDGFDQFIEVDAQTSLDNIFNTNASLAPGFAKHSRKNDEFRLQLDYNKLIFNMGYQKRVIDVGLGVAEALGPGTIESSARWNADIAYTNNELFDDWEISAKFSYFSTTQEIDTNLFVFPPGSDIGRGGPFPDGVIGNPEVFEKHYRTGINAKYTALQDHTITLGFGHDISDLYKVKESKNFSFGPNGEYLAPGSPIVDVTDSPYIFLSEGDRKNNYLLVQDIWQVTKDWELTAGIRYDDYSDFGSTVNPRLALIWTTSLNLTTKFLYGSAFRAPSFGEMRNINNPTNLGNPDLSPEKIDTYEIAFNYQSHSNIKYGASFFTYDWQDIIEYVPDAGSTTKTAQNIGEQQGYGFELEFSWAATKSLTLSGNYAWLSAENGENNTIHSVPEQQLYLKAYYEINDDFNLGVKTNWVTNRIRAIDDLRAPIDDYNLTDLTLSWQPSSNLSVSLLVKNIFDSDAREPTSNNGALVNVPYDLPLAGRTTLVQLAYHFD